MKRERRVQNDAFPTGWCFSHVNLSFLPLTWEALWCQQAGRWNRGAGLAGSREEDYILCNKGIYVFSMLQRLYFVQDGPIKKQFQSLGLISDPISTRQQKRPASSMLLSFWIPCCWNALELPKFTFYLNLNLKRDWQLKREGADHLLMDRRLLADRWKIIPVSCSSPSVRAPSILLQNFLHFRNLGFRLNHYCHDSELLGHLQFQSFTHWKVNWL